MSVNVHNYDRTLASSEKTPLTVILHTWNDGYRRDLAARDRERYDREKERIAQQVIDLLQGRFPGLREAVETIDVSTPHTVHRYTSNWHGSFEGSAPPRRR